MSATPWVVANVIIGGRPEPFFSSCLAGVEGGVDFLVLNDNSGDPDNPNLRPFFASKLFRENRASLIRTRLSDLSGFDEARNLCIEETARRFPDRNVWILYLDSDEVHSTAFPTLTRKFLPALPPSAAVVDGYFYQFVQSFNYYTSIDRRHNLLFKYHPGIRWEKPIHSELKGIRGRRVPTGYIYFHYGYVYSPENIMRRWKLYKAYDAIPFDPDKVDETKLFKGTEDTLVPFAGAHPEALSHYLKENPGPEHVARFTAAAADFFSRHPGSRMRARARELNWRLRLAWRNLQAGLFLLQGKTSYSGKV